MNNDSHAKTDRNTKANNEQGGYLNRRIFIGLGVTILSGLAIAALVWAYVWVCRTYLGTKADEIGIPGFIGLLGFVAITAQIVVSAMQWQAMRDTLQHAKNTMAPRLRITDVDLLGMKIGETPFFTIWLDNEGLVDAVDVVINMTAEGIVSRNWHNEQTVTIAAREKRCFFIKWGGTTTQELIDHINAASGSVKIKGYIRHDSVTRDFCYSYYAIGQNLIRPKGIPHFLPCDFAPGLNITLRAESGRYDLSGNSATLTHHKIDDIEAVQVNETFTSNESISFDIKETDSTDDKQSPGDAEKGN